MPFDQQLRLISIGIGALCIVGAILIAFVADDGGCLTILVGLTGIGFVVYGFTGDPSQLPFHS